MALETTFPEHCRTLFLGDLSTNCSEQDLFQLFHRYGDIEALRVMRGRNGKHLGYGFLTYVEFVSTKSAVELNGAMIMGRPIK
jgi:RNA recognition motif-containing protein